MLLPPATLVRNPESALAANEPEVNPGLIFVQHILNTLFDTVGFGA
jgi:hypothetical protein